MKRNLGIEGRQNYTTHPYPQKKYVHVLITGTCEYVSYMAKRN